LIVDRTKKGSKSALCNRQASTCWIHNGCYGSQQAITPRRTRLAPVGRQSRPEKVASHPAPRAKTCGNRGCNPHADRPAQNEQARRATIRFAQRNGMFGGDWSRAVSARQKVADQTLAQEGRVQGPLTGRQ